MRMCKRYSIFDFSDGADFTQIADYSDGVNLTVDCSFGLEAHPPSAELIDPFK
jgi:hypothetical protein